MITSYQLITYLLCFLLGVFLVLPTNKEVIFARGFIIVLLFILISLHVISDDF